MTKADLVNLVHAKLVNGERGEEDAEASGATSRRTPGTFRPAKQAAEEVVEGVFASIIGALHAGDKIEIRGFGSFRTRQRKARTGRNPKTGDKVDVPAKRVPFFKPSKELRDLVNPKGGSAGPGESGAGHVDPHHPPAM